MEYHFTPGHAPGHICLWNKKKKKIISEMCCLK